MFSFVSKYTNWCVGTQGCAGERHCFVDAVGYLAGGSPAAGVWTCPVPFLRVSTGRAAWQWCHCTAAVTAHCRLLLDHAQHYTAALQGKSVLPLQYLSTQGIRYCKWCTIHRTILGCLVCPFVFLNSETPLIDLYEIWHVNWTLKFTVYILILERNYDIHYVLPWTIRWAISRDVYVTLPSLKYLLTVPCIVLPFLRTDSNRNYDLCSEANTHLVPVPAAHNIQVRKRRLNRLAQW